jgi:hypothetical protein
MKSKLFIVAVSILITVTTSCKKEQTTPTNNNPAIVADINVEYKITNQSSNVVIEYLAPVQGLQGLQTLTDTISKTFKSYIFTVNENELLSVKSWNNNPSWNTVTVDIYVNGSLFKTGTNSNTNNVAKAEGIFGE